MEEIVDDSSAWVRDTIRCSDVRIRKADSVYFWDIMDCMERLDRMGYRTFHSNRRAIVDAFAAGKLFKLEIVETPELYANDEFREAMKVGSILHWTPGWYVDIPAFITLDFYNSIEMIWVHPSLRRLRFGTKLIRGTPNNRRVATYIMEGSEGFWKTFPHLHLTQ